MLGDSRGAYLRDCLLSLAIVDSLLDVEQDRSLKSLLEGLRQQLYTKILGAKE